MEKFTGRYDAVTRVIVESGGLFKFSKNSKPVKYVPAQDQRPMNMVEKMIAQTGGTWPRPLCQSRRRRAGTNRWRVQPRVHQRSSS